MIKYLQSFLFVICYLCTCISHAQLFITADTTICDGTITIGVLSGISHNTDSGYTLVSIPFNSELHAGTNVTTGMVEPTEDDGATSAKDIGFEFCFFGNTYDQIYIATNGWVSFSDPPNAWSLVYGPGGTPSYSLPNTNMNVPKNAIMGPWQDWDLNGCNNCIKYKTSGSAPYRKFVISYQNMEMFLCAGSFGSFQIVLYETYNRIENHIIEKPNCATWEGGKATQAIHNSTGTVSYEATGRDASAWTTSDESTAFVPEEVEWFVGGTLVGTGDSLSVTPLSTTTYTAVLTGCDGTIYTDEVTVTVGASATVTYPSGFPGYCNEGTIIPSVIYPDSGSFSVFPADLITDPVTGEIDLSSGTPGTVYTVTYTTLPGPCQTSLDIAIEILEYDDASFSYSADSYCPEGTTSPAYIATPGGSFTVSPAGLIVNATTGVISLTTGTVDT
ncbi:MAG: hypothetical protein H7X71_06695, partial [Chitinophagales bacterium]|nr:hypothetical protein [Chitinophagales bacterium]